MERAFDQQFYLNRQADQIERALYRLNIPGRVDGGHIEKNHVRYLVTPSLGVHMDALLEQAPELAEEIGIKELHFVRERHAVAIDVPLGEGTGIRLLPLMDSLDDLGSCMAVLGLTDTGIPLLLDFNLKTTWHLISLGNQGTGKTELLRSLICSLALTTKQADVEFLGIDLGGRELALLEALPHTREDLATSVDSAIQTLARLIHRMTSRTREFDSHPSLFLFVDRLDDLLRTDQSLASRIHHVISQGETLGVHLIATTREISIPALREMKSTKGVVLAESASGGSNPSRHPIGRFFLKAEGIVEGLDAAWLSAYDLDEVITRL